MVGENDADDSEEGGTDDARARYDECAVEMKSLRSGAGEAVNDHGSAEDDLICSLPANPGASRADQDGSE